VQNEHKLRGNARKRHPHDDDDKVLFLLLRPGTIKEERVDAQCITALGPSSGPSLLTPPSLTSWLAMALIPAASWSNFAGLSTRRCSRVSLCR
jgi:hypothetical protein